MRDGGRGGGFREQYDRMLRWYARFKRVTEGKGLKDDVEYHKDDMRAFFENCFHLRDWILNDERSGNARNAVKAFVNVMQCMQVCAEIANSRKHLKLTRTRRKQHPAPGSRGFDLKRGGTTPTIRVSYTIATASGPRDAFQLATECVEAWKAFFRHHGLHE